MESFQDTNFLAWIFLQIFWNIEKKVSDFLFQTRKLRITVICTSSHWRLSLVSIFWIIRGNAMKRLILGASKEIRIVDLKLWQIIISIQRKGNKYRR